MSRSYWLVKSTDVWDQYPYHGCSTFRGLDDTSLGAMILSPWAVFYFFLMDTFHPDSQHAESYANKKPGCVRTRLCRYVLTPDWINEFAAGEHVGTPGHYIDTRTSVVLYILRETCFRRAYAIKWKDSLALCIAIGHNKSAEGSKLATPEGIERDKRNVDVDEEPSWLNAA